MRPLPSIRIERTPRFASWAARIVPEAPPPTIATGTRSDLVVRPVLRVLCAGFARDHVVVHAVDRLARGLGEDTRNYRMTDAGETSPYQANADCHRSKAMPRPAHPARSWMIQKQTVGHPRA